MRREEDGCGGGYRGCGGRRTDAEEDTGDAEEDTGDAEGGGRMRRWTKRRGTDLRTGRNDRGPNRQLHAWALG